MLSCPRCRKRVPEVLGAPEQECPHCGLVFAPYDASREAATHAERTAAAPPAPAGSPEDAGAAPRDLPAPLHRRQLDPAGALKHGFAIYAKHWRTFLAFWAPVLALDIVVAWIVLAWQARNGLLDLDVLNERGSAYLTPAIRFLGLALPLYALLLVVKFAYWGATAPLVNAALRGGRPRARSGFQILRARARTLFGASAALTMVLGGSLLLPLLPALGASAVGGASTTVVLILLTTSVLLAIPFLMALHWYLYVPAAASAPDAGIVDAFRESRAFTRDRPSVGFTLAVLLVFLGVAVAQSYAGNAGARAAGAVAPGLALVAQEIAAGVAGWILAPLVACLVAAYWFGARGTRDAAPVDASVVRRAAAPTAAVAAAPATAKAGNTEPAPQAPPRLRTTKCPGCATVFPFTPHPDGEAVRVQCPTCAKAGVVR